MKVWEIFQAASLVQLRERLNNIEQEGKWNVFSVSEWGDMFIITCYRYERAKEIG
jgi:hypothetical protein